MPLWNATIYTYVGYVVHNSENGAVVSHIPIKGCIKCFSGDAWAHTHFQREREIQTDVF